MYFFLFQEGCGNSNFHSVACAHVNVCVVFAKHPANTSTAVMFNGKDISKLSLFVRSFGCVCSWLFLQI